MPAWEEYKRVATDRGALAFELYIVETTLIGTPDAMQAALPAHLAYQQKLVEAGALFLAGPTSDETGTLLQGNGMIVYRAASLEEATDLAKGDPMHSQNIRGFQVRKWLVNECAPALEAQLKQMKQAG